MLLTIKHRIGLSWNWVCCALLALLACIGGSRSLHAEEDIVETNTITRKMTDSGPSKTGPAAREIAVTISSYYIENGKYDEAERFLHETVKNDPGNSKAWQMLGQISLKKHNLDEARGNFQHAADASEGREKGINLYFLADACQKEHDKKCVEDALSKAGKIRGFSEISKNFLNQLQLGMALPKLNINQIVDEEKRELEAAQRINAYSVIVKSGFDNNVLLLPDLPTDLIPASYFFSPALQALHLQHAWGGTLLLLGQAVVNLNMSSQATPYNSGALVLGQDWSFVPRGSRNRWGINNSASVALVQSSGFTPFSLADTLTPSWTHNYSSSESLQIQLPVGYTGYPGITGTAPDDVREGPLVGTALTHRHALGAFSLSQSLGYQYQMSKGRNYQAHAVSGTLTGITTVDQNLLLSGIVGVGYTPYPSNLQGRADKKFTLTLDMSKPIITVPAIIGAINYYYERNFSNYSVADYEKHSLSLRLQYEFK